MPYKDLAAKRAHNAAYKAAHREEDRARSTAYHASHREALLAHKRKQYHDPVNADKVLAKLMRQQLRYHQHRLEVLAARTNAPESRDTEV